MKWMRESGQVGTSSPPSLSRTSHKLATLVGTSSIQVRAAPNTTQHQPAMDLELSLKPKPKDEANDGELASLIARIETQYGAFREVTEESLLEELAKGPQSQEEDVEMSEGNAESEKEKEEKEKLMKETKQKIIDLVLFVNPSLSRYLADLRKCCPSGSKLRARLRFSSHIQICTRYGLASDDCGT